MNRSRTEADQRRGWGDDAEVLGGRVVEIRDTGTRNSMDPVLTEMSFFTPQGMRGSKGWAERVVEQSEWRWLRSHPLG